MVLEGVWIQKENLYRELVIFFLKNLWTKRSVD